MDAFYKALLPRRLQYRTPICLLLCRCYSKFPAVTDTSANAVEDVRDSEVAYDRDLAGAPQGLR